MEVKLRRIRLRSSFLDENPKTWGSVRKKRNRWENTSTTIFFRVDGLKSIKIFVRCFEDVVVADCFNVLLNLLKNNPSNQSFFRESAYIRRLAEFFQLNSIGVDRWTTQKNENVFLLLQVCEKNSLNK